MTNNELYMSKQEHLVSLQQAGFTQIEISLEIKGLCVFKCHLFVITSSIQWASRRPLA